MDKNSKIYVAGHHGLVGSAILRKLNEKFSNILVRTHNELDLRNQKAVEQFFQKEQPEYVFLAAAKVGGIKANLDYPASFIYDNLMINTNVIHAAYTYGVKKLLFLGSSCIYPRDCQQPIKEEYLLTGPLEKTNEPYAVAKIAGITLCHAYNCQYGTNFITCMPTNLYGPNDNFDEQSSHVLAALIKKIYAAYLLKNDSVVIWGTGNPYREFLYVDDLADAGLFLMEHYNGNGIVNIGTGTDIKIIDLAHLIKKIVGYNGEFTFDRTKPDGMPRKLLNSEIIRKLRWKPTYSLEEGIRKTVAWYKERYSKAEV
ncbi:GDP-L-fucose synthase [Candidatus Dependentiae bacterium]|nr:MAG: GDP-L-fucose synthase [Candidatus Dependentiae bacterium]